MSRHQISKAEYRQLGKRHAEDETRRKLFGIKISPAQFEKLQRNAADPAKARKRKARRNKQSCRNCAGAGRTQYLNALCKECDGKGWIWVDAGLAAATLEREHVQPAVEDYLRAEGLVVIPINSGAATIVGGRACLKGLPDLVTWVPAGRTFMRSTRLLGKDVMIPLGTIFAVPCYLECKRPKGGRYSKEQLAFRDRAIADGCLWVGCTCKEDIAAVIPPRERR